MSSLRKGTSLQNGKYIIGSTLGQGGFGITYEAEQVSLRRKVAVKEFFMKEHCNRDEATSQVSVPSVGSKELVSRFKEKFLKEARMLAGFRNQHIVKVHDVFEENGTAYYVMEYLEGGSLQAMVRRNGRLGEGEAIRYIKEVGGALSYIHSKGTLHLDVKPGNIILDTEGRAVLIDFGISKHIDGEGHLTTSTPLCVSKGYASFEQLAQEPGDKYSPATDIYSLGATLYFLLTGKQPYDASSILKGLPTDELEEVGASPETINAIRCAMKVDMNDRPQSVGEFLAFLDGTAEEDSDEETVISGAEAKGKNTKSDKKQPAESGNSKEQHKQNESMATGKEPFPKWMLGAVALFIVVASVLFLALRGRKEKPVDPIVNPGQTEIVVEQVQVNPQSRPEKQSIIELQALTLSKAALSIEEGETTTLTVKYTPSNATDKTTTWKSTDASVAKVSANGRVTAVKVGRATIIANCKGKDARCNVIVKAKEIQPSRQEMSQTEPTSTTGTHVGHEWVDLGLSVKWATCNVGTSSPEGYGSYFAWGETSPKSSYNWENLKYRTSGDSYDNVKFSKYVTDSKYGLVGNKTRLDLSDDAARANWGGSWRIPKRAEQDELREKCTWTWTTMNGTAGYKVTSKSNGNSIFLPAAGYRRGSTLYLAGSSGSYWSSSLYSSHSNCAYYLRFRLGRVGWYYYGRCYALSVRPVCP